MDIREKLIAEIKDAFHGVRRDDGRSAEEAWVIDNYGTDEERKLARESALDNAWEDVATTPEAFEKFTNLFSFLDPKGFRFYLPACMVWILKHDDLNKGPSILEFLLYALSLSRSSEIPVVAEEIIRHEKLQKFSILSNTQASCVAHFLIYVVSAGDEWDVESAKCGLEQYWGKFEKGVL